MKKIGNENYAIKDFPFYVPKENLKIIGAMKRETNKIPEMHNLYNKKEKK